MECTNRALHAPRICRSASTTAWFSRGRTSLAEDGALPVLRCTGILDVRLPSLRVLRLARCTSHDRSVGRVAAAFARVTVHLSCLFSNNGERKIRNSRHGRRVGTADGRSDFLNYVDRPGDELGSRSRDRLSSKKPSSSVSHRTRSHS
jgi:hypothetical protein